MGKRLQNFTMTKYACYFTYVAMSPIFTLPPLLFMTFREQYGISYTALGTLVLINFCTQLSVDLIMSFFSRYFDLHKTLRAMPMLTACGLIVYALVPNLFPQYAYAGLVAGTVLFSVAAGLCEVLLSPTVAALPSDTPEKDMTTLHSLYGYGVVSTVIFATLFLWAFGTKNWMWLVLVMALLPITSFVLYSIVPLPEYALSHNKGEKNSKRNRNVIILCLACIFLGSAAENTMTNWISGFIETALHLPKTVGDILGMAMFGAVLAITRTVYAKYGKDIYKMLLWSMVGAVACYLVAGLSGNAFAALIACVATGICTSMLWPGSLLLMEEKLPVCGVTAYALMASGGDLGASVAPQLMGVIVDKVAASGWAVKMGDVLSMTPDEIGMKVGMVSATLYPVLGVLLLIGMGIYFRKIAKKTQ